MKKQIRVFCAVCIIGAAAALLVQYACKEPAPAPEHILLETDAEREGWLNLRGWRVGQPECTQTRIPLRFETPEGQRWLVIQNAQGLHPENFPGAQAQRYLYPVENDANRPLFLELLLCDGILVGAQVYDAATQLMQSVR